jgi:hypothetical protein
MVNFSINKYYTLNIHYLQISRSYFLLRSILLFCQFQENLLEGSLRHCVIIRNIAHVYERSENLRNASRPCACDWQLVRKHVVVRIGELRRWELLRNALVH